MSRMNECLFSYLSPIGMSRCGIDGCTLVTLVCLSDLSFTPQRNEEYRDLTPVQVHKDGS